MKKGSKLREKEYKKIKSLLDGGWSVKDSVGLTKRSWQLVKWVSKYPTFKAYEKARGERAKELRIKRGSSKKVTKKDDRIGLILEKVIWIESFLEGLNR